MQANSTSDITDNTASDDMTYVDDLTWIDDAVETAVPEVYTEPEDSPDGNEVLSQLRKDLAQVLLPSLCPQNLGERLVAATDCFHAGFKDFR